MSRKLILYGGKNIMFEPVATSIKESITKILGSNDCFCLDCISVFEILKIYREIKEEKEKVQQALKERITEKIKEINPDYVVDIDEFDYREMTLSILVYRYPRPKETKFVFGMQEGIFECSFEGAIKADLTDIIGIIGDEVKELYQNAVKLKEYETTYLDEKSVNSDFFVNLSATFLSIYYNKRALTSDFKVVSFFEGDILYSKWNNCGIEEILEGREMEFVKKIFVSIASCPEWLQELLMPVRQAQVKAHEVSEEFHIDVKDEVKETECENQFQEEMQKKNKKICFLRKFFKGPKK